MEGGATAYAKVRGGSAYPRVQGEVFFYPFQEGSLVLTSIEGLPPGRFLGFHVHETGKCETAKGDAGDFASAGGHFNPKNELHPNHAGDLPVLLSNDGFAYSLVYTERFTPAQVLGRSVVIHAMPDNYRSQPSGDSGDRIACGVVEKTTPARK